MLTHDVDTREAHRYFAVMIQKEEIRAVATALGMDPDAAESPQVVAAFNRFEHGKGSPRGGVFVESVKALGGEVPAGMGRLRMDVVKRVYRALKQAGAQV